MTTDVQIDARAELDIVFDWHMDLAGERAVLQRVVSSLSATALADIDVRAELESRLRALEQSQAEWVLFATSSFERRVGRRIGDETRQVIPCEP